MLGSLKEIILYTILFIGLYFQVFLLMSFFFWGDEPTADELCDIKDGYEPHVGIIVPCYNEERTVERTIDSLLALNYPHDKLHIAIVDDGSTDKTWNIIQKYKDVHSVILLQKKNEGSKFAALNYGLAHLRSVVHADVIGCLDADSTVDSNALRASLRMFTVHEDTKAVMPAMTISEPSSVWQHMQKVEYEMMTFGKQVFHKLGSIFVAPGPFALFKKEVFDTLGPYKEAYHTEDLEICLRMIMNGMRIAFANDSYVYTHGPRTFNALIKQRVRWIYGFVKNINDFRSMLFTTKYGHISILILPLSAVGIWSFLVMVPLLLAQLGVMGYNMAEKLSITGFQSPELSLFYFNTKPYFIMVIFLLAVVVLTIFLGRSVLKQKRYVTPDLVTLILYTYASMYWTIKALINAIRSKKSSWR